MTAYMVRDKKTNQYWIRSSYNIWTEQQEASIWSSKRGASQALSRAKRRGYDAELVEFVMNEVLNREILASRLPPKNMWE